MTGDELRALRESARLTREALGEAVGRTAHTVWAWESGRQTPPESVQVRLARVLNADVVL